jgi:hypothetical protein
MSNYVFAAVATAADVTNLLNNKKASKARVAAVGQEDAAKRFNAGTSSRVIITTGTSQKSLSIRTPPQTLMQLPPCSTNRTSLL